MTVAYPPALFSEVLDFLVTSPSLQRIIDYKPSPELEDRLSYLLTQNKQDALNETEKDELDAFLQLNHFVNMLKIRARKKLAES